MQSCADLLEVLRSLNITVLIRATLYISRGITQYQYDHAMHITLWAPMVVQTPTLRWLPLGTPGGSARHSKFVVEQFDHSGLTGHVAEAVGPTNNAGGSSLVTLTVEHEGLG